MAKKKTAAGKVNKSALIRSYLIEHSGSSNQEVAAALSNVLGNNLKKGAAMVAQVKTLDKKKPGKGKRGRKRAAAMATAPVASVASTPSIDIGAAIKAGRELLKAAGSPAEATAIIKALGA